MDEIQNLLDDFENRWPESLEDLDEETFRDLSNRLTDIQNAVAEVKRLQEEMYPI